MKTRLPIIVVLCVLLGSTSGIVLARPDSGSAFKALSADGSIVTNGPYGGAILQLANQPGNSTGIYAAVRQVGLFHSADSGQHWTFLFSGIGDQGNFAIDSLDSSVLYATRQAEGLYRSQDGGATWQPIPLSGEIVRPYSVRAFAHPATGGTVYAAISYSDRAGECGSHCGLYRSEDYGDSWTWIGASPIPADAKIDALAFLPANPAVVYAGADDGALYRSADGGDTWSFQDSPLDHVSDLVFAPDGTLFVIGSGEGVSLPMLRCTEDTAASPILDCRDALDAPNYVTIDPHSGVLDSSNQVTDLKVNPATPSDLLVSTGYRVARSLDGGSTWTFYDDATSPSQPSAVLYDPAQASSLFAGNGQGVWQTNQANAADYATAQWDEVDDLLAGVVPGSVVTAPSDPLVVYVNSSSGMYRTADGAATWERLPTFCEGDWCYLLDTPFAVDPQNADKLVQAAWNYTVHLSDDGGETWTVASGIPRPTTLPALDHPGDEYVISIHALIAVPGDPTTFLAAVAFHRPDNPDLKVYAGGGIYKSVDGGQTWTLEAQSGSRSIFSLAYDPTDPQRVYAGACELALDGSCGHADVLYSDDGGSAWNLLPPGDEVLQLGEDAREIAVRPTDGRLYVACGSGLIWIDKGGSAWTAWGSGLPISSPIDQLLFDPSPVKAGRVVYAATSEGLFVIDIAAASYDRFEGDLGQANATALGAARSSTGQDFIFVGTAGGQFGTAGANLSSSVADQADHLVQAGVYRVTGQEYYNHLPMIVR